MTACGKTCAKEEEKRPLHNDHQALHVTILHALPGRLRLQYEIPVPGPGLYETINGMTACTYNPVLRTMLCCYDAQIATEKQMLMSICGTYAAQVHAPLIHVRHAEEERFSLTASGGLSLISIAADALVEASGLTSQALHTFTKWLSVGTTLTAIVEHGYTELMSRGSFDPEVMSVVYLVNALGRPNTLPACAIAWGLTFGRHLLPTDPRETAWLVREQGNGQVTLTPVAVTRDRTEAVGALLSRSLDVMAHRGVSAGR